MREYYNIMLLYVEKNILFYSRNYVSEYFVESKKRFIRLNI